MSRPEKPIDWKKVDHLLMAGCKGTEICPHFDMHPNTFYSKVEEQYKVSFTEYSRIKREQGDSLLRVKQYEKALEKDNTMMIWLGKQRLEQREPDTKPPEHRHETDMEKVITHLDNNGLQPQTDRQLQQHEREDQHLGRGGSVGENVRFPVEIPKGN